MDMNEVRKLENSALPIPLPGGLLAIQFEPQPDGTFHYRRDNIFPPRVVSREERDRFVGQGKWIFLVSIVALFAIVFVISGVQYATFGDEPESAASWTMFVALFVLGAIVYYQAVRWLMHAPWRAVRHRPAVGPARTRAAVAAPFIKRRSYGEIARDTGITVAVFWFCALLDGRMWTLAAVLSVVFILVGIGGAIVKFRVHRAG